MAFLLSRVLSISCQKSNLIFASSRYFAKKKSPAKEDSSQSFSSFDMSKVKQEMDATLKVFESHLQRINIGRGDPRLFDEVYVPSKHTKLSEISQIIPKNANEITIKPFDPNDLEAALEALNLSEIKMVCRKDSTGVINISIPKPTQDFRNELIKQARNFCEETKQNIRKKRQNSLQSLKDLDGVGEDEVKRLKNEIQKITEKCTENAEKLLKDKEKIINS